jgi:sugar/nucleoside kinase (ribokinase family)
VPVNVGRSGPTADGCDLLVVGDANPDVIVEGDDVVPAFGQVEKLVDGIRLEVGGASAIAAAAGARLGLRTAFASLVGDDLWGRFMLEQLARRGVDVRWCRVDPDRSTGVTVILSGPGDRAILTAPGAIHALTAERVDRGALAGTRHLHVGGAFLQPRLLDGLPPLLADARASGTTTSLDPNWDPSGRWDLRAILPHLDLLLPNEAEARALTGTATVDDAARILIDAMPPGALVVVKAGEAGVLARGDGGDGEAIRYAGYRVRSVDAIGAGDTFDAALIAGLLRGLEPAVAVRMANAAGALSTMAAGGTAAQPSWPEVEAFVASDPDGGMRLA